MRLATAFENLFTSKVAPASLSPAEAPAWNVRCDDRQTMALRLDANMRAEYVKHSPSVDVQTCADVDEGRRPGGHERCAWMARSESSLPPPQGWGAPARFASRVKEPVSPSSMWTRPECAGSWTRSP